MDDFALQQWQVFTDKFREVCQARDGDYDCIALFSGGKDSAYMLYLLSKIGARILAATIDFGFLSPQTRQNIVEVTRRLSVEHRFISPPWEDIKPLYRDSVLKTGKLCYVCEAVTTAFSYKLAALLKAPCLAWGMPFPQFVTPPPWILEVQKPYWSKIRTKFIDRIEHVVDPQAALGFREKYVPEMEGEEFYPKFVVFPLLAVNYTPRKAEEVSATLGWVRPTDVVGTTSNCYATHLHVYLGWKTKRKEEIDSILTLLERRGIVDARLSECISNMKPDRHRANEILQRLDIGVSVDDLAEHFVSEGKTINPFGNEP